MTVDVTKCAKCHQVPSCHAKRRPMSPSATPATQSDGGCHQAPRLPRKTKADVTKCHACHANGGDDHGAKRDPQCRKCHACHAKSGSMSASATPATRDPSASPEPAQYRKCHACHAKRRPMSPSATPATQTEAATTAPNGTQARHQSQPVSAVSATPATQSEDRCQQAPRLPRKTKVTVTERHACHANGGGDHGAKRDPKRVTRASPVP